jgi:prolyl oligopeptidase PreP (S9A serine peptidase family)
MGDLWMTEGIRDSVAAFLTFVPTNSGVICTGKEYLVAIYMEHAQQTLTIFDILGKEVQKVALPDVGTVGSLKGRKEDFEFFYSFTGFVTPGIKYRFDLGIVERELLRELYQGQMNGCHIIIINGAPGREICWMRAAG